MDQRGPGRLDDGVQYSHESRMKERHCALHSDERGPWMSPSGLGVLQIGLESLKERPGGLNRYFVELLDALSSEGISVHGIVTGAAIMREGSEEPLTTVAGRRTSLVSSLLAIRTAVSRLGTDVDVIDAHFALTALPVFFGSLRRRPLIVHFHGPWADEGAASGQSNLKCLAKRFVERFVYRRASTIIVLSNAFRRVLIERYGVLPWDVEVMAPGVDTERFRPGDSAEARAALGVPTGTWVAVAVRRLVPRMGLDILLEAWAVVVAGTDNPVLLLVAGDGPSRVALEDQVDRLGLREYVRFLGRVDDGRLVSVYRVADVSVVPSVALEGYGLVVLESLATGTPVVASAVGGLSITVGDFDEGLLVLPGDPGALAERIGSALHQTKPLPLASDCRLYAEAFSWSEVARNHIDLYRRLLQKHHQTTEGSETVDKRPIRVVVVGHAAELSGGELAISRLISAMANVNVHVVLAEEGPLIDVLEEAGATVEVLPMNEKARGLRKDRARAGGVPLDALLASVIYTAKLARRLRQLKPDLVHTNTLKSALYGGVAARAAGVPCLWHVRDRIAEDYLPRSAVKLVRLAARYLPTDVVANSRTTLATLHLPKPRLDRVVYDGVAGVVPSQVVTSPIDVTQWDLRQIDASRDRFRVAMVGRLTHWKGQDVFLKAFAEAFAGGPEQAVLIGSAMFGEDKYERHLVKLVSDLGIGRQVEFRGFQSDMKTELERVDAMIHASLIPEPFGQVVVEGMAASLAVVASDAGGPAEIITHDVDGLLYPPGDVRALATLLRRLADDPLLRQRLGNQAARTAEGYSIANVATQVVEVYRWVLSRNSRNLVRYPQ